MRPQIVPKGPQQPGQDATTATFLDRFGLAEEGYKFPGGRVTSEVFSNGPCCFAPERLCKKRIAKQTSERLSHRFRIVRRNQQSIHTVADQFGNTGDVSRNHRQATRHCFHQHVWNAISISVHQHATRQTENCCLLILTQQLFLSTWPSEM